MWFLELQQQWAKQWLTAANAGTQAMSEFYKGAGEHAQRNWAAVASPQGSPAASALGPMWAAWATPQPSLPFAPFNAAMFPMLSPAFNPMMSAGLQEWSRLWTTALSGSTGSWPFPAWPMPNWPMPNWSAATWPMTAWPMMTWPMGNWAGSAMSPLAAFAWPGLNAVTATQSFANAMASTYRSAGGHASAAIVMAPDQPTTSPTPALSWFGFPSPGTRLN